MKMQIRSLALTLVIALAVGCSSTSYERAGSTSTSLQKAAKNIDAGNAQITIVLVSLSNLVNSTGGDLRSQYKRFDDNVSDLQSTAQEVSEQVREMSKSGNDYFKAWDEQLAQIQNENIKSRGAVRKAEVQQRFTDIKRSYLVASDAFKPFMADLRDIRTALSADLTTGGLASVKDVTAKAQKDSIPLREAIAKLSSDFKALGVSLSPTAPNQ